MREWKFEINDDMCKWKVKIFSLFSIFYWLENNLILISNIHGQEDILYMIHYNIWGKYAVIILLLCRFLCKSLYINDEMRLLWILFGKSIYVMSEMRLYNWRLQINFVLARKMWNVDEYYWIYWICWILMKRRIVFL